MRTVTIDEQVLMMCDNDPYSAEILTILLNMDSLIPEGFLTTYEHIAGMTMFHASASKVADTCLKFKDLGILETIGLCKKINYDKLDTYANHVTTRPYQLKTRETIEFTPGTKATTKEKHKATIREKAEKIKEQYNKVAKENKFPTVAKLSDTRISKIKKLLSTYPEQIEWKAMFAALRESDYLANAQWFGFDYLIRSVETFDKIKNKAFDGFKAQYSSKSEDTKSEPEIPIYRPTDERYK